MRCKQPAVEALPALPRADEWVSCAPALGSRPEECRLSEDATLWVSAALGVVAKLRGTLRVQNTCLDDHEEAGLIQQ